MVLLRSLLWLLPILCLHMTFGLELGVGRADITGPIAEIGFMGYAQFSQRGKGLHLRQFSRAFIFDDGTNRFVFVSADCAMIPHGVRKEVLNRLQRMYGLEYSFENLMISCTHTHSTPGGFMQDLLFDLTTMGFIRESFNALVDGISLSIHRAHQNVQPGKLRFTEGEVLDANINRSPTSYLANPEHERARYEYDVDKTVTQLQLISSSGNLIGMINWFAVHATSMNYTNKLVSSDNVGYASILLESFLEPGKLSGKTNVVATFASSNLGDVSPNIKGPRCQLSGDECDLYTSRCRNSNELCIASGPGKDMTESTLLIAQRLANKAKQLWDTGAIDLEVSSIDFVHQFIRPPDQEAIVTDPVTGETKKIRGCIPAMGYSFAAGTTDGPGSFSFQQSTKTSNPMWNIVRDFLAKPTKEDVECHAPKPILLATGRMDFTFEWQPEIASTQMARLGDMILACVPGEFTTMSGRRLRDRIKAKFGNTTTVVVVGLCNTYTDYITTPEEYTLQRYEAASTIFGPYTLPLYLDQFDRLADAILQKNTLLPGPEPPELLNDLFTLQTPVLFDFAGHHNFGDCLDQPRAFAEPGDTVRARFVSGNPRNNLMHEKSYLVVERKLYQNDSMNQWEIVAVDADWSTRIYWERTSVFLATSEVLITWNIPLDARYGKYRIRHMGYYKHLIHGLTRYSGSSRIFEIKNDNGIAMDFGRRDYRRYGPR